jgi:hypothetical protein
VPPTLTAYESGTPSRRSTAGSQLGRTGNPLTLCDTIITTFITTGEQIPIAPTNPFVFDSLSALAVPLLLNPQHDAVFATLDMDDANMAVEGSAIGVRQ